MDAREAEFDDFVASRSRALLRTAYLLTGDHHHAEDLLQVALVEAARRWEKLDEPEAYVRRVLYTRNISRWRKRHVHEVSLLDHDRAGTSSSDPDLRLSLEQALARLTTKQRTILVLRFFEDLTEQQTGDALGISRGTVKSVTRQAFARLRALAPELADLIGASS